MFMSIVQDNAILLFSVCILWMHIPVSATPDMQDKQRIRFTSFNIWSNWRDRDTRLREVGIENVITDTRPEVVALQEISSEWRECQMFVRLSSDYGIVRWNETPINHTPILYRRERLKLLDSGYEVFNVILDKSKSVTWSVLEDRNDGRRFIAFSTHLWHKANGAESDAIREGCVRLIQTRISEVRRKWGDIPAIGGGDMNSTFGSVAYAAFCSAGWSDAMKVARAKTENALLCSYHGYPVKGNDGRYHGRLFPADRNRSELSIDHIFVTPGMVVLRYDMDVRQPTLDISDHSPLVVDFTLSVERKGRKVFFAGDSTLDDRQRKPDPPYASWGTELEKYMRDGNIVCNFAKCGASSKSFLADGRWSQMLENVGLWDFVVIQFGHNDQKRSTEFYRKYRNSTTNGTYEKYLTRFAAEVRAKGGIPMFATSIARASFGEDGHLVDLPDTEEGENLRAYADAAITLAGKLNVDVVDMNILTHTLLEKMGKEEALKFFVISTGMVKDKEGKPVQDVTHPTQAGAEAFARLFIKDVCNRQLPIRGLFRNADQ